MSHEHGFGKRCPDCGEPCTDLRSINARQCAAGCKAIHEWSLADGQRPLLGSNRTDRNAKPEQVK